MTSAQVPSRIAMPCPFGGFGTENITPIQNLSGTDVNFPDGFPAIYGAPVDNNGRFVTRKEMNSIGRLASLNEFYRRCGGINTFDPDFCAAIGGYPKGAILEVVNGTQIARVMSLLDDNKIDFRGITPTHEQAGAGITAGRIDGISWILCNQEDGDVQKDRNVFDDEKIVIGNSTTASNFGIFTSNYSGLMRIKVEQGGVPGPSGNGRGYSGYTEYAPSPSSVSTSGWAGTAICIKPFNTLQEAASATMPTVSDITTSGWNCVYNNNLLRISGESYQQVWNTSSPSQIILDTSKFYVICVCLGYAQLYYQISSYQHSDGRRSGYYIASNTSGGSTIKISISSQS